MRPFIGVDDLEAMLGFDVDENELIVGIALDAGCEAVRSFLGQDINYTPGRVETIDGHGTKKFRLHERPIRKLYDITLDGLVVDPSLYNLKDSTIRRTDDIRWPVAYANITATYDSGYDVIPDTSAGDDVLVPADMRLVALIAARRVYIAVGKFDGVRTRQSESIGQYSYTLSGGASVAASSAAELLAPEKEVLLRYRIGVVPAR